MKFIVEKVKKQWTPEEVTALLDVAEFVALDLEITDIRSNVYFKFLGSSKSYFGYCEKEAKNSVTITLFHSKDLEALTRTLAHEMVHAKQFLRGELTNSFRWHGSTAWKKAKYEDQPWEQEAIQYEETIELC
jgi:hypothetical protein